MIRLLKNALANPPLWGGVIPLQFLGCWAIYLIATGQTPSWWWASTIIGYICITMIGVGIGYHRMCSHRSLSVNRFTKLIILWLGGISSQGSPIFWATMHRGYHHRYADQERDPHSPNDGFWHSYILWLFKLEEGDYKTKYITDLLIDKDVMFFHKYHMIILWTSHLLVAMISLDLWLWCILLPSFLTFHKFALQASVTHYRKLGYRNYNTSDNSANVWWLWPFILGEAWHNNHHGEPNNPNFGRQWWELDPTYWVVKLIRKQETV